MPLAADDLRLRLAFAHRIADAAGQRLLGLRQSGRWREPALLGDVGDQAADAYLQGSLQAAYPADGLLSEETKDAPERLQRAATWIVDPLDGTKEYSTDRHDFAVHVGLAVAGEPVLGVVSLPAIGRTLTAVAGGATTLHGSGGEWPETLPADAGPPVGRPLRLVVSRSHTPDWVQRLASQLGGAELVPCGSVGCKVAMLLFGRADVYVHDKGLKEWDTCAPEVVARAAGWSVCRFDGQPQRYNLPDPRCDQIVVCRPWLRDRLLPLLAR
jgi:3'(2'), 5'-bisphosphate nucleotidase